MPKRSRQDNRVMRHERLRKRVTGDTARPRLAVFRSLKHIYAQIIDDTCGNTLVAASSEEKEIGASGNIAGAKKIGAELASRAKAKGIDKVVFDRGGFKYHGRIASLADGAREGGLEF